VKQLRAATDVDSVAGFFDPAPGALAPFHFAAQQFLRSPAAGLRDSREREQFPSQLGFGARTNGFQLHRQLRLARLLDQLLGAEQGREMLGNAVERGGALVARAFLFSLLDFFPVGPDFVHVLDLGRAKHMRMTTDEFVHQMTCDLLEIERSALASQLTMENHLQQQVTQFLGHLVVIARFDGVNQLIDLFDGVAAQGQVVLLSVPRAALGRAQFGHDAQELVDRRFLFHKFGRKIQGCAGELVDSALKPRTRNLSGCGSEQSWIRSCSLFWLLSNNSPLSWRPFQKVLP